MVEFINYYKILQVDASADLIVIDADFRKLSSIYHPDINKDSKAEEKYKIITEAYFVLKDKEKRKKYDEKYSKFNAKDYEEKKYCKECGREIPLGSTESYCQECDDYLDERFSIVQLEILKEKKISKEQIEFLDKFETEEIIDLYLEIRDAFLMGNGIKKDELNILLKLQESFNLGNIKII